MKSIISGFFIGGEIGRRLAEVKELRNSDVVWSYPTFALSFIDNPAPLLLYDEIIIDRRVAPMTIEYLANAASRGDTDLFPAGSEPLSPAEIDARMKTLEQLFSSPIFNHVRFETRLNNDDINEIRDGVQNILRSRSTWFKDEVEYLKLEYGPHYANPSPLNFEALNTELFWTLSKKFSDQHGGVCVLDDCIRGNLYRYKIHSLIAKERTKAKVASEFLSRLPKYAVGLPPIKLLNVDDFLEMHQSQSMNNFREIVSNISNERNERARIDMVERNLYRANEEIIRSYANESDGITIAGLVLAVGVSAAEYLHEPSWLAGFGFASSTIALWPQLRANWERISRRSNFGWFNQLKSYAEKQPKFYSENSTPWPLPDML